MSALKKIPNSVKQPYMRRTSKLLRLGYVRLADAAPFIMAQEAGLFERYGLQVELSREVGWATIRDKIIYNELDACQALGPMPFAASLGLSGGISRECITSLVLNIHGNRVSLSKALLDPAEPDASVQAMFNSVQEKRPIVLGVVSLYSSHLILLRKWLKSENISCDKQIRFVVMPPDQMVRNLEIGNLDGFCAGEPWNEIASNAGIAFSPATSSMISQGHPEKVLMVRHDFAAHYQDEYINLLAAMLKACELCDNPDERKRLVKIMAMKNFVNCSDRALKECLSMPKENVLGSNTLYFHRFDTNNPSIEKALWILEGMEEAGLLNDVVISNERIASSVFASEFYLEAKKLV